MADTVLTRSGTEERGLTRIAQRMAVWTEKWFPDAYIFALAGVVIIALAALALVPSTARMAVSFVAMMSMSVSFLNWGLSLMFGGLLARAIARRKDLTVDYRALGAAAFMGLRAVWALGLSSSAAQPRISASTSTTNPANRYPAPARANDSNTA